MKSPFFARSLKYFSAAVISIALLAPTSSHAQNIYLTNYNNSTVNEFDLATGAPTAGFTPIGLSGPGMALTGNNLYITTGNGVEEYNATTGARISSFSISVLNDPTGLAISGNTLYAVCGGGIYSTANTVTAWDATTGQPINGFNDITGLDFGYAVAVSGNALYVLSNNDSTIGEYNATTGAMMNASFITGASGGVVVSGNNLYTGTYTGSTSQIGEFNASTGAAINTDFSSSGVSTVVGLAISGNDLYVANHGTNSVTEYDANSGTRIAYTSPSGLSLAFPAGIVVTPVPAPEPGSATLLELGVPALAGTLRIRRRKKAGRANNAMGSGIKS